MEQKLRLSKILVPEDATAYYFVTFTSGEHETTEIVERHDIDIEVMVEGSVPLGEVERLGKERAIRLLKALAAKI
ncbi:MAG: hypothetical protein KJ739_04010 [Nitrospinae bacterium]|nr:hypothetical protein [Nitrospinota bacterium]MCG2813354.1 hypothetical protein [Thermodesulfovibrionales bacterium]